MKPIKKYSVSLLTIIFLFAISCSQPEVDSIKNDSPKFDENDPVFKRILNLGFRKADIEDLGEYYLVEGDITFTKNRLTSTSSGRAEQARTDFLVSFDRQPKITVRIDNSIPTAGVDNWRPEIQQAINDWNSVGDSRMNMVLVDQATTQTHITIISDASVPGLSLLDDNVVAAAEFPQADGSAGFRIRINLDFLSDRTVTTGQKRRNMVHELGHCIGLRHTNWSPLGEQISATTIAGTPGADNNSVMNGGTALNEWIGLSNFDQIAVSTLYPESLSAERVFELEFYTRTSPDVDQAFGGNSSSITSHWLNTGIDEGRIACSVFETKYYLQKNSDVAQVFGINNYRAALNHWLLNGINEGRQGSPAFNSQIYLQRNSDIRAAFGANNFQAALDHWLSTGIVEGRQASANFDVRMYLNKYGDIKAAFGTNYKAATLHYLLLGRYEGRTAPNP